MKVVFALFLTCLGMYALAQRCATDDYIRRQQLTLLMTPSTPLSGANDRDTFKNEIIVIPVVIHILYNNNVQNISDDQVLSQLAVLNEDYRRLNADAEKTPIPFQAVAADTRLVFCLAKVDPQGRYTSGITRKYTKQAFWLSDDEMKFSSKGGDDVWDSKKYLNIWVCNLFGRTLGYSVIPGGPADKDGVVMQYNVFGRTGTLNPQFNRGRTATHEIGHWLGLKHIWGDALCGNDGVDDTPPQQTNNSYCPSFPHNSSCSINAFGDMFMNYMDFADDGCMNLFTSGQKKVMRSMFALGNPRNSFLGSNVCDSSQATAGALPIDSVAKRIDISVYPNPFSSEVSIKSANPADVIGKRMKLFDISGKIFVSQLLQSKLTTISLAHLSPGVYFIKIEGIKSPGAFKIIKQGRLGN